MKKVFYRKNIKNIVKKISMILDTYIVQYEYCRSLRRKCKIIHDLDFVVYIEKEKDISNICQDLKNISSKIVRNEYQICSFLIKEI